MNFIFIIYYELSRNYILCFNILIRVYILQMCLQTSYMDKILCIMRPGTCHRERDNCNITALVHVHAAN